jgi:hypothetical protein
VALEVNLRLKANSETALNATVVFAAVAAACPLFKANDCRNFNRVSWTPSSRRRLSLGTPVRRSLTGGTAEVTFEVVQSLSASSLASAGEFAAAVSTQVGTAVSTGALTTSLATACGAGCGLEATASSVALVPINKQPSPTKSPAPAPTRMPVVPPPPPPAAGGGSDGTSAASSTVLTIAIALALCMAWSSSAAPGFTAGTEPKRKC